MSLLVTGAALAPGLLHAEDLPVCAAGLAAGVRPGLDGWLFDAGDLRTTLATDGEALDALLDLARRLARSRSHVVVLLLPPRGLVAADRIGPLPPDLPAYDPAAAEAAHREVARMLAAAGLDVVDTLDTARALHAAGGFTLPRDHHPTPEAARALAVLLADHVRARGDVAALPEAAWTTRPAGQLRSVGSRGIALAEACGVTVPETVVPRWRTVRDAPASGGLLDDAPPIGVVMVGTSNLGEAFNLPGHLQQALGTEVLALHTDGGGPLGALDGYLRSPDWAAHPPPILVWELSTGMLLQSFPGVPQPTVPDHFREIAGAVDGGCTDAEARWSTRVSLDGDRLLDVGPVPAGLRTADTTIQVVFDDASVPAARLELDYADGATDRYTFGPFPRLTTLGRFHLSSDPALQAPVTAVRLGAPGRSAGAATLRVCPARGR